MKHVAIPVFVILLVALFGLLLVGFQVRETEVAFVTRFGQPVRPIRLPGLYFKLPTPIERVRKYDSRMRVFEGFDLETTTKGAVPLVVKSYVVWKVADPLVFFTRAGTITDAEGKIYNQLKDTQNRVIGQHSFGEFVNSDPNMIRIDAIQADMLEDMKEAVEGNYGIEVTALGIKQLKVSEEVTAKIFERMKAARNLKTQATITEGEGAATKIRSDAELKSQVLMAAADARALSIKGEGDAEAAKYYKLLEAEPEFAVFLKNLEALKAMLKERTTFVVPLDAEPFKLLKEIPELKLKTQN